MSIQTQKYARPSDLENIGPRSATPDDEDYWGVNYTEPTAQIRGKIETILHIWGEEQPETKQDEIMKLIPERERFSVPHASRDPKILPDINLENEDIFELIKNPLGDGSGPNL